MFAQRFETLEAAAGTAAAHAVLAPPAADFAQQVAAVEVWRAQSGNALVTLSDPAYPPRLRTMADPPPLLYVKGRLDLLHARSVAVVGSRSATPQARAVALGPEAQALLAALGHAPATLEILAQRTDMSEALLQATLLRLELAGQVSTLPGGRFVRASHC